eukprot:GFUD01027104.1.p1 GENE.GFUD01027104.1~~GFUD01027104.1.p1  ORF type:complete len:343 (-),score=133.45 GFUD01027104.1:1043-2071(-)
MEQSSLGKKKTKDCYHYQIERCCPAGLACTFYHRQLDPDICTKFIFGLCKQRADQQRCPNLHVRESHLPFPPTSELVRLRSLQESAGTGQSPATPASLLSRPGQLRNIKRLLGGSRLLQVRILTVESEELLHVRPAEVVEEALQSSEQLNKFYCSQTGRKMEESHQPGQLCAVLCGQAWYRAVVVREKVEMEDEEDGRVLVQLLDKGDSVCVPPSRLYQLAPQFQYGPSWSLPCHLARIINCQLDVASSITNCQLDMGSRINDILSEVATPRLVVLGSPQSTGKELYSVPVDIQWDRLAVADPFLPLSMEECSLSAVLVERGVAEWTEEEKLELQLQEQDKK